ncbi:MAG: hypothetical protein GEV06_23935, partial [Luteitalea sp.]|nr:hypothetical protein [Luteitalea sp.]
MSAQPTAATLRFCLFFIRLVSVIVPASLRKNWQQEWGSELHHRWQWTARSGELTRRAHFDLLRRSAGSVVDAVWL